ADRVRKHATQSPGFTEMSPFSRERPELHEMHWHFFLPAQWKQVVSCKNARKADFIVNSSLRCSAFNTPLETSMCKRSPRTSKRPPKFSISSAICWAVIIQIPRAPCPKLLVPVFLLPYRSHHFRGNKQSNFQLNDLRLLEILVFLVPHI